MDRLGVEGWFSVEATVRMNSQQEERTRAAHTRRTATESDTGSGKRRNWGSQCLVGVGSDGRDLIRKKGTNWEGIIA